jgi:imidazolonepropionase-like amidohydrolase
MIDHARSSASSSHAPRLSTLGGTLALLAVLSGPAAAQDLAITNARILDGTGGVIERGTVVVRDGRIAAIGATAAVPNGVERIDAAGKTVLPGFIDAHRHLVQGDPARWLAEQSATRMQEFLDAGFTTVFSAIDPEQVLELRRRIDAGQVAGPRLVCATLVLLSGLPLGGGADDPARTDPSRPPGRPTQAAPGFPPEQTRAQVQAAKDKGYDAIKTLIIETPNGPERATLALIEREANRLGMRSVTHAVSVQDTLAAVEAGTDVLMHTPHIGQLDDAQVKEIVAAGLPMISTLAVFVPHFDAQNRPLFRDDKPFPMSTLSSAGQGPVNARLLWEAGITYAYGTDTQWHPRITLAEELRPLRLVFSPQDIVKIITSNAAVAVGRDDIGTLAAGKLADIVILNGDPLADIDNLLNVAVVIKGGKVVAGNR